jgi:two-component system sensor histidine kinase KdpD
MGGTLTPEDTPGGGLTMVLSLPTAVVPVADRGEPAELLPEEARA